MNKVHHDELEGKVIELSLQWDEHAKENIEYDAPFFRIVPNLHAAGAPIFLTIEDACAHAALDDSGCRDCGSCRHYRLQPRGLLGTCGHPPRASRQDLQRLSAACRAHPLLCLGKGEWAPAADLLMTTNDDTRGHKRRKQ